MELRQLQYFLLIAQELSFAKAAKKAFVSQQALSKSMLSLEGELEVPLFERLPHGVALTPYGHVLAEKALNITSAVNEAITEIHNIKANHNNTIQLAITNGVENCIPIEDLLRFQELYPQYRISTIANNDLTIEEWLYSGKIEIGLLGAQGNLSRFDFLSLQKSKTFLAIHKSNPLSRMDSVRIEDLRYEHFLFGSDDYYANSRFNTICNLAGFVPEITHQTENIVFIAQMVASAQGVFLCPDNSLELFRNPDVVFLPFRDDPYIFCVYLVTKKDRSLSKGAELMKKHLIEIVKPKLVDTSY